MKLDILDRFERVGEAAWSDLEARSLHPVPFLSWSWQTLWWEAFGDGRPLKILRVADSDGQPVGLLPLYEKVPGIWQLVGGVDISDYLDVIAVRDREEEVWVELLQHRAAEPEVWDLHCVRAASPTVSLLPALAPAFGLSTVVQREERCPVVRLPDSWDGYLGRLSGKDRHELRRKLRRLEREWPGARVRSHTAAAGLDAAMDAFLTLHRKSKAGKARFMDTRMEGFFRRVAMALAARGSLRLWFLERDGAAVATYFCLEFAGSVAIYNSGFDPVHAALSPGTVLLAHVLRDAIERRVTRFDFLRGDEPYKYAFGGVAEDLFNVVIAR
ncbi:MAG: GNAT family N-acetyltransferase [Candidatus Rokubacteria bacterium]|nr:GNAT family N-acetyltransferase [Candidatus Rokubacteria bacterium]